MTAFPPDYEVLEKAGQGGFGVVFKARQVQLGRLVAIKVIHGAAAEEVERFLREGQAVAKLRHPAVVQVYATGTLPAEEGEPGAPFLVFEWVEGSDLAKLIKSGPLKAARIVQIARDLFDGLEHAHAAGIVHRDVKPANIMLPASGLKIADFGLARMHASRERLTRTGVVMGTPTYMAPEQASGGTVDHRADLYAAGAILFELLAGVPPFTGDDPLTVLRQQVSEPAPPLETLVGGIPPALENLGNCLLVKDPAARPASARAVLEVLARVAEHPFEAVRRRKVRGSLKSAARGGPPRATRPVAVAATAMAPVASPSAPSRRRAAIAAGGVALLVALALGAWALRPPPAVTSWPSPSPSPSAVAPAAPEIAPLAERPLLSVNPTDDSATLLIRSPSVRKIAVEIGPAGFVRPVVPSHLDASNHTRLEVSHQTRLKPETTHEVRVRAVPSGVLLVRGFFRTHSEKQRKDAEHDIGVLSDNFVGNLQIRRKIEGVVHARFLRRLRAQLKVNQADAGGDIHQMILRSMARTWDEGIAKELLEERRRALAQLPGDAPTETTWRYYEILGMLHAPALFDTLLEPPPPDARTPIEDADDHAEALIRSNPFRALEHFVAMTPLDRLRTLAQLCAAGRLRRPELRDAVMQHLRDPDAEVAWLAVRALARLEVPDAAAELRKLILSHGTEISHTRVLVEALRGLARIGGAGDVDAARRWMVPGTDGAVRAAALHAWVTLAPDVPTVELVELLRDKEEPVRAAASWGLRRRRDPATADALIAALAQPSHGRVPLALAEVGGPRTGEALRAHLRRGDLSVWERAATVWALGYLGVAAARPELEEARKHASESVARRAREALRLLANRPATPPPSGPDEVTLIVDPLFSERTPLAVKPGDAVAIEAHAVLALQPNGDDKDADGASPEVLGGFRVGVSAPTTGDDTYLLETHGVPRLVHHPGPFVLESHYPGPRSVGFATVTARRVIPAASTPAARPAAP